MAVTPAAPSPALIAGEREEMAVGGEHAQLHEEVGIWKVERVTVP